MDMETIGFRVTWWLFLATSFVLTLLYSRMRRRNDQAENDACYYQATADHWRRKCMELSDQARERMKENHGQ